MAAWIEVQRAHAAVAKALRDGIIVKKPCEVCGDELAQAHHSDYSKPLSVRWLCPSHHRKEHISLGRPLMDSWTVLNIRGVPNEIVRRAKLKALDLNVTLKDLVIAAVESYCTLPEELEKKLTRPSKPAVVEEPDPLAVALELAASGADMEPKAQEQPVVRIGCKCGGNGVMVVNGKRCCAKCGRALGS